jgi:hypothetical protein
MCVWLTPLLSLKDANRTTDENQTKSATVRKLHPGFVRPAGHRVGTVEWEWPWQSHKNNSSLHFLHQNDIVLETILNLPEGATNFPMAFHHGRTAQGGHGLPKVLLGPTLSDLSTPCGQVTLETAFRAFQRWPACKTGGLRLSPTFVDT